MDVASFPGSTAQRWFFQSAKNAGQWSLGTRLNGCSFCLIFYILILINLRMQKYVLCMYDCTEVRIVCARTHTAAYSGACTCV